MHDDLIEYYHLGAEWSWGHKAWGDDSPPWRLGDTCTTEHPNGTRATLTVTAITPTLIEATVTRVEDCTNEDAR